MKLILGTAEFGKAYGHGVKHPPGIKEIRSILALAKEAGIDTLDTAQSYGCSQIIRGTGFKIITKVRFPYCENQLMTDLGVNRIDGLLYHYGFTEAPIWWSDFHSTGRILAKGASIYDPKQLTGNEDIVQLPISIGKTLPKIGKSVTVHARSVFGRGELLKDYTVKTCLDYVKGIKRLDGVVVGVNSRKELEEILLAWGKV